MKLFNKLSEQFRQSCWAKIQKKSADKFLKENILLELIKQNDLEAVKLEITRNKYIINQKGLFGFTPLNFACFLGRKEIAKFLIDMGADINIANNEGCNPLIQASKAGLLDVVEQLIKNTANINTQDENGDTALIWAVLLNNKDVAIKLIKAKSNLNIRNKFGYRAIDVANRNNIIDIDLLELLKNKTRL